MKRRPLLLLITVCMVAGLQSRIWAQEKDLFSDALSLPLEKAEPGESGPLTLDQLVQEARERNPAIAAANRSAESKKEMIVPARTLADPTLGFQTMGDIIPPQLQEGDPSSARTFSIEQEIPFPGKLTLRGKIAEKEAETEQWNAEQTARQVIADLKTAYYDLYLIDKSIEIVQRNKDLLQKFVEIAEEKYRVGEGIQQDVLKAQVELSKLIDRLTVLEQRRGVIAALLNSLLYRPPATKVGKPAEVKKADMRYSIEQLNTMAQDNYPELIGRERDIERNQFAVELSQKNYFPDFTFGFTYFDRTVPEMYGIMFNVKVPLYFWRKQRHELASATASLDGARKQRDNTVATLYARLTDNYLVAKSSAQLVELYQGSIIPQAQLSLESALAGYQVGKVDFLTLLDNLVTLLDYELKYFEVLTDYQKALARLEVYVGVELTT